MAVSKVSVTAGVGTEVATYDFSESALTKQLQRIVINNSSGTEVDMTSGTAGAPAGGVMSVQGVAGGTTLNVGQVTVGYDVSQTFTAGTTGYVPGDVVGGARDLGVCGPSAKTIMITSVQLLVATSAVISGMTSFTLHLFSITPPSAVADSAQFLLASGDRASYLGSVSLGSPVDLGDSLYVEQNGVNKQVKLAGTNLFGYLVSAGTYTPASEVYTVTIHTVAV